MPGCLLQCEFYRLLKRQSMAFLPGTVEGNISHGGAERGHASILAGAFRRHQRRSAVLPQSLRSAPDAGGAKGAAKGSSQFRHSLQRISCPLTVAELAPDQQALMVQRFGGPVVALPQGTVK